TTGSLPTGLATATKYYVKNVSGNTFNLSATPFGTAINTSGTQSGTHTATNAPWEGTAIGNGTTTFTLPDFRGYFPRGVDNAAGVDANRSFGANQTHAFQTHGHSYTEPNGGTGHTHLVNEALNPTSSTANQVVPGIGALGAAGAVTQNAVTGITITAPNSGNVTSETRPSNQTVLYVIRY